MKRTPLEKYLGVPEEPEEPEVLPPPDPLLPPKWVLFDRMKEVLEVFARYNGGVAEAVQADHSLLRLLVNISRGHKTVLHLESQNEREFYRMITQLFRDDNHWIYGVVAALPPGMQLLMAKWFTLIGKLVRRSAINNTKVHAVVEVDPQIGEYARHWVERELGIKLNIPRYPLHITAIRDEEVAPKYLDILEKLNGVDLLFECGGIDQLRNDKEYWWLPVKSPCLLLTRTLVDLPHHTDLTRPPDGEEVFHITVGNTKGQ